MSTLSFDDLTDVSTIAEFLKFIRSFSHPLRLFRTWGTEGELIDIYFNDYAGKNKKEVKIVAVAIQEVENLKKITCKVKY